jgi:Mn-dependent DtxR family transcriptional regulator
VSDTETAVAIEPCTLFSFLHAARVMTDTLDGALSETNLSAAMLDALTELVDAAEPLAPLELAARLNCSFAEIAALVDALDAQALIERQGEGIALTPKGHERQRTGSERVRAAQRRLSDAMAAFDADALERTLAALRAAAA